MAVIIPLLASNIAQAADQPEPMRRIELAQLSPAEIEAKKKAEQNKQKQQTPPPPQGQPRPQQVRPQPPQPPQPPRVVPQQPRVVPPPPPPVQRTVPPPPIVKQTPPVLKPVVPPPPVINKSAPPPVINNQAPSGQPATPFIKQQVPSAAPRPVTPSSGAPLTPVPPPVVNPAANSVPFNARNRTGVAPTEGLRPKPALVPFAPVPLAVKPQVAAPVANFKQLQQTRQTQVVGGRQTLIKEGGNRTIVKDGNVAFIRHDEADRFRRLQNARTTRLPNGVSQTFYIRPDGVRVVSETDRNGRLLRRFRRGPDGREHAIIDNRRFWRNVGIGVGVGALVTIVALNLRPPVISIPRDRYIMEYDRASDDDLYETLIAPPLEPIERVYSLEEVRYSPELRDRMRRVDLDAITFEFGSFEIGPEQYGKLERLAKSINRVLGDNADAVFLIEGHTDAIGSQEDNLSLSDRRAQSVAQILSEQFGVPPENLVTQGYGEQYLKVPTQDAERANRRVTVRNISKLVAEDR